MVKRKARALTRDTRQTGTSDIARDKKLKAIAPGKRRSKKGNIYYERRKNRSDVKGRDTPRTKRSKIKRALRANSSIGDKRLKQAVKRKRKMVKRKSTTKQTISNKEKIRKARIKAYKEKIERKKERLQNLASRTKQASSAAYKQSSRAVSMIPMGQPILVGHHSERSHRNAIKRSHAAMDRSVKLSEKAGEYERRLKALENNYAISSDDPEAVRKLKKKVLLLEKKREQIKKINRDRKKQGKSIAPAYMLQNLGQNILSVRKRIVFLKNQSKIKTSSKTVKGIRVIKNAEINRVQLEFPGKPNAEIRTLLKGWGFRWSPREGRWQRMLNNSGMYAAKMVVEKL